MCIRDSLIPHQESEWPPYLPQVLPKLRHKRQSVRSGGGGSSSPGGERRAVDGATRKRAKQLG
eukprot:3491962-Alexandrium_andersonii.AAC.1